MDVEYPITEIQASPEVFSEGGKSVAAHLFLALTTGAITTHEGGFFVHMVCERPPSNIEYTRDVNALLAERDEVWRLESCMEEYQDSVGQLVLLFRTIDMHEALSF
jgi:hypothetical protein